MNEHSPLADPVYAGINELTQLLRDLDDRGLALSLAAFAEDALGSLLSQFMIASEATRQLLEGFNAPLGTLSARSKACLSLGLITRDQYDDLERLRKIRNEFAHQWRQSDLSNPSVAAHVRALSYGSLTNRFPETAAEKLRESMTSLLIELRAIAHQVEEKKWGATVRGTRLIAGFPLCSFEEQLHTATSEFAALNEALRTAIGERRVFQESLLRRFASKIGLLYLTCPPSSREALAKLQAKVTACLEAISSQQPTDAA